MDAPAVAALKAALSTDNVWLERSTIAVFFGVVIEMADLIFFNKEMGRTQRIILFVATVLVVAGCGGEWVFEHDASDKEARLQQISDEKVAGLAKAEAADNRIAQQAASTAAALGLKVDALPTFVRQKEDELDRKSNDLKLFANATTRHDNETIAELNRSKITLNAATEDAKDAEAEAIKFLAALKAANIPSKLIPPEAADTKAAASGPNMLFLTVIPKVPRAPTNDER